MKNKLFLFVTAMLMIPMAEGITGMQKVKAMEMQTIYEIDKADAAIVPYADVIETVYRIYQGKVQYRRWNKTKGYWVDSDWITVG